MLQRSAIEVIYNYHLIHQIRIRQDLRQEFCPIQDWNALSINVITHFQQINSLSMSLLISSKSLK